MMLMEKFFDKWGLIAQAPPGRDGGDGCQRWGMYYFALWVREQIKVTNQHCFKSNLKNFEVGVALLMSEDGYLRRHCNPAKWYSDWDRASRDQSIPFVVACGALGQKSHLKVFFLNHLKRGLCFTSNTIANWVYADGDSRMQPGQENYQLKNWWERFKFFFGWRPLREDGRRERVHATKLPDFTGPEFWALYIRAFDLWFLYPALILFDLLTLGGSYLRRNNTDKDVLNHCIVCLYGHFKYPTPTMWVANRINNWDDLAKKMHLYFNHNEHEISDMFEVWKPILMFMKGWARQV